MAIALHAFFPKISHRKMQKDSQQQQQDLQRIRKSNEKIFDLASDFSDFCHYICCFFLFWHKSHSRQKFTNILAMVTSPSQ